MAPLALLFQAKNPVRSLMAMRLERLAWTMRTANFRIQSVAKGSIDNSRRMHCVALLMQSTRKPALLAASFQNYATQWKGHGEIRSSAYTTPTARFDAVAGSGVHAQSANVLHGRRETNMLNSQSIVRCSSIEKALIGKEHFSTTTKALSNKGSILQEFYQGRRVTCVVFLSCAQTQGPELTGSQTHTGGPNFWPNPALLKAEISTGKHETYRLLHDFMART